MPILLGTRIVTGQKPDGSFARGVCSVCGQIVALRGDGIPIRSHRRGVRHQRALAAARKSRDRKRAIGRSE